MNAVPISLIKKYCNVNFQYMYFRLKMVVRPKHVVDNLSKIVNKINYNTETELRYTETPEPDLIYATGCKQQILRLL
jgi:hypothetical protein